MSEPVGPWPGHFYPEDDHAEEIEARYGDLGLPAEDMVTADTDPFLLEDDAAPCGSGKLSYGSRRAAELARERQAGRRGGKRLSVYRCPDCGDYHLTSQR